MKQKKVINISGINNIKSKININKFILKLGGSKNIKSIDYDSYILMIDIITKANVNITFFRHHKSIKTLFFVGNSIKILFPQSAKTIAKELKIRTNK